MRVFPTCLLALCSLWGAQPAAAQRTVLNHAAFVTSADGYANVRARPSSRSEIIGRVTDKFFLVISCEPGREGHRWCFTGRSRADENLSSGDRFGWIHESQFDYDPVGDAPDETL